MADFSEGKIIEYLQKIMDSKFARFIMKNMSEPKKIQKALAIYAGVEEPSSIKEKLHASIVAKAIEKSADMFNAKPEDIKNFLKDSYIRKGFSVIIRGIAEYGITKPQRLSAPFMVVWDFTKQCNLKCKHCYANATPYPAPDELSLEQRYEVVDQLDEAGVAAISFSGGEPLINKDFWPVAEYASKKGFYLSVATNGTLISEEVAKRLKKIGIRYVEISIDGPTADIHDSFRGIKGAFDRAINGIKNAKEAGLEVGIATTATHHNLDMIPDIVKLARDLNVDRLIVFNFIPTGRGKEIVKDDLSPEEREKLMEYLHSEWEKGKMQIFSTCPAYARVSLNSVMEKKGHKVSPTHFADFELPEEMLGAGKVLAEFIGGCGAGRIYCSIEHNGDIQPCVFIPIKVGNVIKDGFQNVWDNSEVFKILRDRDAENYACSKCPYRYVCGGCRARSYAYYGNLVSPDPGCIIMKDEWEKILKRENVLSQ
ncbi:MAG: radical SAM protein [Candidatus Aenigmarchaeota archaeon]|nr:radical SAM protein [Candidatus Aenigmarchaeota archaeon]